MKSTNEPELTPAKESQLYTVLPRERTADGLLRAPLSAILACWPASYAQVVRAAIEQRPPSGLVHYDRDVWITRWHVRWLAQRCASVMRGDAAELIALADAAGGAQ